MKREYEGFLRRLRQLAGENVSEFARNLGLKQSVVYRYLKGTMRPGYEFFHRLDGLNIDLHWLFSGEGEPYRAAGVGRRDEKEVAVRIEGLDQEGQVLVREFVETYKRVVKARKPK